MSPKRTALGLLFGVVLPCILGTFPCGRAFAHTPEESAHRDNGSWRVQVNIVAKGRIDELEAVLREWFQRNSIRSEIRRISTLDPDDVLSGAQDKDSLRVWVTFPKTGQATVYYVEPGSQRFLLRDVPLRSEFDEIAREQLVQVIVTSANAFMERRASTSKKDFTRALSSSQGNGTTSDPLKKGPRPKETQRQPPSFQPMLRVGGYYGLSLEHKAVVAQGPGLLIGVAQNWSPKRAFFDLRAQYLMPNTVQTSLVDIRVRGVAFQGILGLEHQWLREWTFGAELGAGLNRVSFEPQSVIGTGVDAQASSVLWRPALIINLRAALDLASTHLAVLVGGAQYLKIAQYVVLRGQTLEVVYQPFLLEPHCALEFSWH